MTDIQPSLKMQGAIISILPIIEDPAFSKEEKIRFMSNCVVGCIIESRAPKMLKVIEKIFHTSEDKGVAGCAWGDTDYDSESVAFGYNLALENIKEELKELIEEVRSV